MIIVKNDFFKPDIANLIARGAELYQWSYSHKSDVNDPAHNKFFVCHLWNDSSKHNFFYTLWKIIQNEVSSVQDCKCWRIIANGQVKGQNGNWHTDHGDKTVLYYPMPWKPEWGGSTYLKIADSKTEIQYKKNQLVVFDSAISHYGSSPTVDNILRISIAFNLRLESERPLESPISEHDFVSALKEALDRGKPDTAVLASAAVSRFGPEPFSARAAAVIGRLREAV
jgi:hypothetical protein